MTNADLPAAIDAAIHNGVGTGYLTSIARRLARSESTAADLDGLCSCIAQDIASTRDPNVTTARVLAALQGA